MAGKQERSLSRTLFFYIFKESAFSFFVAFLFFFFVFFVNNILLLAEDILSKNAPISDVLLLIFFSLPSIVALSSPFAALVGVLMAIGRLSSDNEITLIRASGLSYLIIYLPTVTLAILISLFSFFTNDVLLPAGTLELGKVYRKLILSTPALSLEANTSMKYKDTTIVTGPLEDDKLTEILIFDKTESGEDRLILATKAKLLDGGRNYLNLLLEEVFVHSEKPGRRGNYEYTISEELEYSIRQEELLPSGSSIGPREMSSIDVAEGIKKRKADLTKKAQERGEKFWINALAWQTFYTSPSAFAKTKDMARVADRLQNDISTIEGHWENHTLRIYIMEFYKKFSIPFGALFLVFLAVPLALFARKSGQGFTLAFGLIISVFYWALLLGGQTAGIRLGYNAFLSMWAPNFIVLFIGIILSLFRIAK